MCYTNEVDSNAVIVKSSDESVATVSTSAGSNGIIAVTVTGCEVGTATITATTTDGSNLSATCTVTVVKTSSEEPGGGDEKEMVWTQVTDSNFDSLVNGSVVNIYPHGKNIKVYAKDGQLNAAEAPEENSSRWKLIAAGNGYFYVQNMDGLYWAEKDNTSELATMTCTTERSEAAMVTLVWNPNYNGVAFKNSTTGKYLNDLRSYGTTFNWWSAYASALTGDSFSTFDLYLLTSKETGIQDISDDEEGKSVYYHLNGVKLAGKPQQEGIYIRMKDGKSQKIVIRKK